MHVIILSCYSISYWNWALYIYSFYFYTHTHTHTHMLGFHVLWGLSIDVMVFILYKLYILSPYTAPIPKPNHHRRHSAILHFQKTSLSLIYKLVSSWGPKNVPTRTRILDIAILVGTFCPHNVGFTWTTHTHTHTHTHIYIYTFTYIWMLESFIPFSSVFFYAMRPGWCLFSLLFLLLYSHLLW